MDSNSLVQRVELLLGGGYGPIVSEETDTGYNIVLPEQTLFQRRILASVAKGTVIDLDFLIKQQLARDISVRLSVRNRNARWRGEYRNLTPELLEQEGVDLTIALTDFDYITGAVEKVHKKVEEGEAVLADLAKLLLYKYNVSVMQGERNTTKITYTLPTQQQPTQQQVLFEGLFHRSGAWPTTYITYTQRYGSQSHALKDIKLAELVQLRDKVAELPNLNMNLTITGDLLNEKVKEQVEATGKRELSDKLNLSEAFGIFQKCGLILYRGNDSMTQEDLLAHLYNSITSISSLQERSIDIPFDFGHGIKVNYRFTIKPRDDLIPVERFFLAHGDVSKLGLILDYTKFSLKPGDSLHYADIVARLLRDGHIITYSSEFTNEIVRFLKSRILEQGTLIGADAYRLYSVNFGPELTKIGEVTIDSQRKYPALLIKAIEDFSTAIHQLPPNQQEIYQADTGFILSTWSSEQPKELDFLTLLNEFSKSLKVLQEEKNVFGVLSSAMPMYAYEHKARGITLQPRIYKGSIGIFLNYAPARTA